MEFDLSLPQQEVAAPCRTPRHTITHKTRSMHTIPLSICSVGIASINAHKSDVNFAHVGKWRIQASTSAELGPARWRSMHVPCSYLCGPWMAHLIELTPKSQKLKSEARKPGCRINLVEILVRLLFNLRRLDSFAETHWLLKQYCIFRAMGVNPCSACHHDCF